MKRRLLNGAASTPKEEEEKEEEESRFDDLCDSLILKVDERTDRSGNSGDEDEEVLAAEEVEAFTSFPEAELSLLTIAAIDSWSSSGHLRTRTRTQGQVGGLLLLLFQVRIRLFSVHHHHLISVHYFGSVLIV
ncbi:hypothetical protein TYRP_009486 [Tyrophagus putrescentiae]|nr:hypothetical protein TYRP_009486 [Tyrophagus putrescentiae]